MWTKIENLTKNLKFGVPMRSIIGPHFLEFVFFYTNAYFPLHHGCPGPRSCFAGPLRGFEVPVRFVTYYFRRSWFGPETLGNAIFSTFFLNTPRAALSRDLSKKVPVPGNPVLNYTIPYILGADSMLINTVDDVEGLITYHNKAGYHGMNGRCPMRTRGGSPACREQALIFSQNSGESAGMAINGNSMTIWNPADAGCLTFVDEDGFASGRNWQITTTGSIKRLSDRRVKQNIRLYKTSNILQKLRETKGTGYKLCDSNLNHF